MSQFRLRTEQERLEDAARIEANRAKKLAQVEEIRNRPIVMNHNRPGGIPSPALASFVRSYNERHSMGGRI